MQAEAVRCVGWGGSLTPGGPGVGVWSVRRPMEISTRNAARMEMPQREKSNERMMRSTSTSPDLHCVGEG